MPKKSTSKTARTTTTTGKKRGRPSKQEQKKAEISRAWSILIFALGVLWFALCFVPGEALWEQVKGLTFNIFGATNYLIGIILVYLAVLTAKGKPVKWKMVESVICVLLAASLIHIIGTAFTAEETRVLTFKGLWEQGRPASFTGGWIAGLITIPLINNMGIAPAAIIVTVLTAVFAMMLTDTTPYDLYKKTKAEAEKQKAELEKAREEMREQKAAKLAEKEKLAAEKEAAQSEKPKAKRRIDFEIDEPLAKAPETDDVMGVAAVEGFDQTFTDVHMHKQLEQQKIEEIIK
ncbi:MAG: hypothetical protein IJ339_05880, partial [Oscillospiraceae bacterium]|nr:hypothetical protein [Oscillospiraceae bacterium]